MGELRQIESCAEFKDLLSDDRWCLYCSDPKCATHLLKTSQGTGIPVFFGKDVDIDFMMSYRCHGVEDVALAEKRVCVSTAFLPHVGLRPEGSRIWVDALQHLGEAELVERTVKSMGRLYRDKECILSYYENVPLHECITSATRTRMWQESCIRESNVSYQTKAHELVHRYLKGELGPTSVPWTLSPYLVKSFGKESGNTRKDCLKHAWLMWIVFTAAFAVAAAIVGAIVWATRSAGGASDEPATNSTNTKDKQEQDATGSIDVIPIAIFSGLFALYALYFAYLFAYSQPTRVFAQDADLRRIQRIFFLRFFLVVAPMALIAQLCADFFVSALCALVAINHLAVFFFLLLSSVVSLPRSPLDAARVAGLVSWIENARKGETPSAAMETELNRSAWDMEDIDVAAWITKPDETNSVTEMLRNLSNVNISNRAHIPGATLAVLCSDIDVTNTQHVQAKVADAIATNWREGKELTLLADASSPVLRDPFSLSSSPTSSCLPTTTMNTTSSSAQYRMVPARDQNAVAAASVATPNQTALTLRINSDGMFVVDGNGVHRHHHDTTDDNNNHNSSLGLLDDSRNTNRRSLDTRDYTDRNSVEGTVACDPQHLRISLRRSPAHRAEPLPVHELDPHIHMTLLGDSEHRHSVQCSEGDVVICVGGPVVACQSRLPLCALFSQPGHGTVGRAAIQVGRVEEGREEGWVVTEWVRNELDRTRRGLVQTVTRLPLGLVIGFQVQPGPQLSIPCASHLRASESEFETVHGPLTVTVPITGPAARRNVKVWVVARTIAEHPYFAGQYNLESAEMRPGQAYCPVSEPSSILHFDVGSKHCLLWRRAREVWDNLKKRTGEAREREREREGCISLRFHVRQLRVDVAFPGVRPGIPLVSPASQPAVTQTASDVTRPGTPGDDLMEIVVVSADEGKRER